MNNKQIFTSLYNATKLLNMKLFLLCPFLFFCQSIFAQNEIDSVHVNTYPGFENKELYDVFAFQGITQNRIEFVGKGLKGKQVLISFEEYKEGKIICKDKITSGLPENFYQATSDTFKLKLLCQSKGDSTQIAFYFKRFSTNTVLQTPQSNNAYSMRFVLPSAGKTVIPIPLDAKKHAILSYSLPYEIPEEPGAAYYCALTAEGIPPEQWWEKYHVKHYTIFYVQFK